MFNVVGFTTAILSAVFNGSFAVLAKLPCVEQAGLPPLMFELYVSVGVFLSSWLAMPFFAYNHSVTNCIATHSCDSVATTFHLSGLGLVAGSLLSFALFFSFTAIQRIGLSLAQAIWGGSAVVVSFLWGVLAFPSENHVTNWLLCVVALASLVIGLVGVAFCQSIATYCSHEEVEYTLLVKDDDGLQLEKKNLLPSDGSKKLGILSALIVGLFGGSILVPMHFVKDQQGLVFLPSFGIGCLTATCFLCAIKYGIISRQNPFSYATSKTVLKDTVGAGIISGIIWNLGNTMSIFSIPRIGYAIAYPVMQCALLVSGLWGIFLFKEIKGAAITVFFLSSAILIVGAVLLATSVSIA